MRESTLAFSRRCRCVRDAPCPAASAVVVFPSVAQPCDSPPLFSQLVYRTEGFLALYSGMGTHLLRSVPNAAVVFYSYEFAVRLYKRHVINDAALLD